MAKGKMTAAQEKKDMKMDNKQGIKENSGKDVKLDANTMMNQLKSARNMK